MHQELGGDRTRTAAPGWPKGCPTPGGIMLNNTAVGLARGAAVAWGLAGHRLAGGEQLHHASLVLYVLFAAVIFYCFSFLLSSPYLTHEFLHFSVLSPIPLWGGERMNKQLWGA